ncbi:MAG: hypothetical protein KDB27_02530 [Planctomycetales bacterium]|nr:hypothetical protein [Planctomycetales bacterium]
MSEETAAHEKFEFEYQAAAERLLPLLYVEESYWNGEQRFLSLRQVGLLEDTVGLLSGMQEGVLNGCQRVRDNVIEILDLLPKDELSRNEEMKRFVSDMVTVLNLAGAHGMTIEGFELQPKRQEWRNR